MKKLISLIFISLGFINLLVAQDSEKEWKKKLKDMDPMTFKSKMEELDKLKADAESKDTEIMELKSKNEQLETEKLQLTQKLQSAPAQEAPVESTGIVAETPTETSEGKSGVVFKVQIGAFRNKDLGKYFNNNKNFSGDVDPDGTQKYTIGVFTDYWEADRFKKYMREMGVNDAWIVAYKNGKRVDIKDVLEGVVK